MNKDIIIKNKIIPVLKEEKTLIFEMDTLLFKRGTFSAEGDYNISWKEFSPYFIMLNNVQELLIGATNFQGDIYTDICKLKGLKSLVFETCDLSHTEKSKDSKEIYVNKISQITTLEDLRLIDTNLNVKPNYIFDLNNLKKLSIIGNNFYTSNFHIKLRKGISGKDIFNHLKLNLSLINEKKERLKKITKHKWGLSDYKKNAEAYNFIITTDAHITDNESILAINSISIYLFTEAKYEYINYILEALIQTDKELNCFEKKKTNEGKNAFDMFFYYEDDSENAIDYETVKQYQKEEKVKYDNYFVNDLLKYLGGEELISEIEKEKQNEAKEKSKRFYKNNTHISSISIENFKPFTKQKLENLSTVNVLVGKNSSGKTSLLQAIAAGLIPQNNDDIISLATLINLRLLNNEQIPYSEKYAKIHIHWQTEEKAQRIYEREIVQETIKSEKRELPQSYLVLAYGENLYSDKLAINEDYQTSLAKGNSSVCYTKPLFRSVFNEMTNPLYLLFELSEGQIKETNKKFKPELYEIAQIIKNKLNTFLATGSAKRISIKKDGAYFKFFDEDSKLYLNFSQISEGYRSYIILITDIIYRILSARKKLLVNDFKTCDIFDKVKGVILIDEFDRHMHPTWQRTFLSTLRTELPLIQFFLSTHNIVSLQSAEGDKIFNVKEQKGEINLCEDDIPIGYSIEALYEEYFDENIYSDKITKKIIDFERLRNQILQKKDYSVLDSQEFKDKASELSKINSQLSVFVETELYQLQKLRENDKTE